MQTELLLEFADGEYPFKLSVKHSIELQEHCKAGFGAICARVCSGCYFGQDAKLFVYSADAKFNIEDLIQTIRLGLIGGGMEPIKARTMVERYCYPEQPLKDTWQLAAAILLAAMEGYETKSPDAGTVKKKRSSSRTRKEPLTPEPSTQTSLQ